MIDIEVEQRILKYCENQVKKHDFGQRGVADGTREEQLTGIIGECTVQDYFGYPLVNGSSGFDEGVDIVYDKIKIDVKTMGRTTPVRNYYVCNFIALQENYDTDAYIFCSYNKKTHILTICGWVTKKQLFEHANKFDKGKRRSRSNGTSFRTKADLYEIKIQDLNNANSEKELKQAIKSLNIR